MNSSNNEGATFDFSPFFEHLPIAVFVANENGQIVFRNKLCLCTFGSVEDNLLGGTSVTSNTSRYDFKTICQEVLAGNHPDSPIVSVIHAPTQKNAYYRLSAGLFLDKYVLFSAIDQTEKIELEQMITVKKNQFHSIINSLGDLVFKLDRKGIIRNIWAEDLPSDPQLFHLLEGKHLSESFPQLIADAISKKVKQTAKSVGSGKMEFSYPHEGTDRWFAARVAPVRVPQTLDVEEFIVIVKEITEKRKRQQQNEYKNKLIKQLTSIKNGPLLHLIEGDPPQFKFILGSLSSLTGYSDNELSEKNWYDLIHEDDREYVLLSLKDLLFDPTISTTDLGYRIKSKDGSTRWLSNQISKADDGERGLLIGVILNVTEIHGLHDKLKQRERILTNTSHVARIGGWEYDFKNEQFHFTDELYQIHEREPSEFDVMESANYYIEDHQPIIRQYLQDLVEKGKEFDDELQLVTGKGTIKWIRAVGNAEWHNGKITHVYGVIQDIDEKKKQDLILKEKERRFNAAFELAPLGIGLLSPEGRWMRANTSLTHFFELSEDQLIDIPIADMQLFDDSGEPFDWNGIFQSQEKNLQWEEKYLSQNGKTKWGRFSITAVKNVSGKLSYFILQVVDITESKEYEENLIIARKEAEDANKIKSDFLSTMTHEIRTPLFGVIGITDLLLEEIQDPNHLKQLAALKFSSDSLLLLVNDILDFSKIKSGVLSLELKPFDLKRVVEAIEELNQPRAKEEGNRIVIDYDSHLAATYIGDELRIGQILNNLVNNAVKFTQEGLIEIGIRKTGEIENSHQLLFSIKDTGIGIAADKQAKIFEQFTQADSSISRRYGGTGLGLSIAKGLVEAMDSQIRLVSDPGKGTTISFELVLEKSNPEKHLSSLLSEEGGEKDLQGKTILLVEDNSVSMLVSAQHLLKWNAHVIQAVDGKMAVEKYLEHKDQIDLVLMDINIPLVNGIEAAEQIKTSNPKVPIVAVTASSEASSTARTSIQGYLIKPFSIDEFYQIVKRHLA